ncbi:hypothetical protein ACEQPO_24080 [Bacillus sp. SL00103]
MAGAFISEFAETRPGSMDIAGTATTEKPSCFGPTGATGVMVRSLATFVERFEGKK